MSLVSQRDSKNLKYFIDAPLQLHIVLYDCYKAISDYGTVDLEANGILRCPPELLDTQMLLDPFVESSTLHRLRYSSTIVSADAVRLLVRNMYLVPSSESLQTTLRSFSG